jgi:hypothetical protein
MDLSKVMGILKVDALDEAAQTEIKSYLENLIEVKAVELTEQKLEEHKTELEALKESQKEELVSKYETLFEEYKEDVISKFSNFVDSILDEEMSIPDTIVEYARKGELYNDLIDQFKIRLSIDEGVLDDEVNSILSEAKEEIVSLQDQLNKTISENLTFQKDATKLASSLYKHELCADLSEDKRKVMMSLLENINEKNEIDTKFHRLLPLVIEEKQEETHTILDEGKGHVEGKEDVIEEDVIEENKNVQYNVMDRFVQILRENKV